MKYTYFHQGTGYVFDPRNKIYQANKPPMTSLDFHKELVRLFNSMDCYILSQTGEVISVN